MMDEEVMLVSLKGKELLILGKELEDLGRCPNKVLLKVLKELRCKEKKKKS